MPSSDPAKMFATAAEALQKSGQRGIISGSWNHVSVADLPEDIIMLRQAPHQWLFPHMAGVVHHGGAGTTAAGLRAGVPSLIVPHMADQPYWARRVYELGVGAKPVPHHQLTADRLADGIRALATSQQMKQNAAALGEKIRQERGVENAVEAVDQIAASINKRAFQMA
jgi:sterol 3beta-glucosyltransferase